MIYFCFLLPKMIAMLKKMMMAGAFLALVMFSAQADENEGVNWLTIEEAEALSIENPKMIFIDIYTDWCSWCRRMDAETMSHSVIAELLNTHFYPVKLNAEQKGPIVFRGETYVNQNPDGRRSAHDFARAVLQGRMGYPSVAVFDEEMNLITSIPGFRPPANMEAVLAFFFTGAYLEDGDLDAFMAGYEGRISE